MRTHLLATALGMILVLGLAGSLAAQQRGALREGVGVQIDQAPGAPPDTARGGPVDERALRYYAAQYDYARVDQEITRLKALHPSWEPPGDLFGGTAAPAQGVDVSGLWAAYDRGDYEAVRRDIDALRQINPTWQPPAKLLDLMAAAEMRAGMKAGVAAGDWQWVVALAEQDPRFVSAEPQYIENLWMAAEAHFRLGDRARAYGLYRSAWAGGVDPDLRLSTLHKALANRDAGRLGELLALEAEQPRDGSQQARFEQIRRDAAGGGGPPSERSRLGLQLARVSAGDAGPEEIARIEGDAERLRHADAAQVLGWYHYDREGFEEAERWFERSLGWQPSPGAAEGLARTLMATGESERAEAIAREWAARDPKLQAVLADLDGGAAFEGNPRERLAATTRQIRRGGPIDPGVLVAHGWALYELERVSEATHAFERAREASSGRARARGDAVHGLAHALAARGLTEEAHVLLQDDALGAEQRAEVEEVLARREALDAYHAGRHEDSLELIRMLRANSRDDASLAALEAWNLLELGELGEARAIFAELHASFPTVETRAGLRAVLGRQYPTSTWM